MEWGSLCYNYSQNASWVFRAVCNIFSVKQSQQAGRTEAASEYKPVRQVVSLVSTGLPHHLDWELIVSAWSPCEPLSVSSEPAVSISSPACRPWSGRFSSGALQSSVHFSRQFGKSRGVTQIFVLECPGGAVTTELQVRGGREDGHHIPTGPAPA